MHASAKLGVPVFVVVFEDPSVPMATVLWSLGELQWIADGSSTSAPGVLQEAVAIRGGEAAGAAGTTTCSSMADLTGAPFGVKSGVSSSRWPSHAESGVPMVGIGCASVAGATDVA